MIIFDDIERTDIEPASHLISRGDYLNSPEQYVALTETSYYEDALALVPDPDPIVLVSSDDAAFCRTHFAGRGFEVLDGIDDRVQFALLARCDHLIMANSTFGWWAAWLSETADLRITPSRWWGEDAPARESVRAPVPDTWIEVPV